MSILAFFGLWVINTILCGFVDCVGQVIVRDEKDVKANWISYIIYGFVYTVVIFNLNNWVI